MKRHLLMLAMCGVLWASLARPVRADEPVSAASAAVSSATVPNAAVNYWTAFAALPTITQEQREKMTTAAKGTLVPIPEELRASLRQYETALREMHRAAQMRSCDWQLDYAAGPHLLLRHLQHARDLAWAALVRAQVRFESGDNQAALDDVLAVLKMGRDCGRSPLVISMLVDGAIERLAGKVLARHLSRLSPEQLSQLGLRLRELPPTATASEAFRKESEMFGGWVARRVEEEAAKINDPRAGFRILEAIQADASLTDDLTSGTDDAARQRRERMQSLTVEELRSSVRRMQADFGELAGIAELPPAERGAKYIAFAAGVTQSQKLDNRDDLMRCLSIQFLPSYQLISQRVDELQVRRSLLDLAIQVQLQGPDVLQTTSILGGKVTHRTTDTGFELRCQIPGSDSAETLEVTAKK